MFRLDNKVAVVIGGAGGLGEACAVALARQGAKVVVASRNLEKLNAVVDKIKKETGGEASAMAVDALKENSLEGLRDEAVKKYGTVDILVNAHGINAKMPPLAINFETWDNLFITNVRSVAMSCKVFGKLMLEKKKGKIINLSSIRGIRGTDGGNIAYGATKGAVDMITRMFAAEWAALNINVNAIGPGVVMTEMSKKNIPLERQKALLEKSPVKRFATPEDVAGVCVYLAAPESDFVNGQIIYVDGGITAVG
jgi:NAD(P)-dependent dehydrogenase (short-subunit alcohol dehydrogenase family)